MDEPTEDARRRMRHPEYRALYEQREAARPAVEAARPALMDAVQADWVFDIVAERLAEYDNDLRDAAQAWLDARAAYEVAAAPSHEWARSHPEYR